MPKLLASKDPSLGPTHPRDRAASEILDNEGLSPSRESIQDKKYSVNVKRGLTCGLIRVTFRSPLETCPGGRSGKPDRRPVSSGSPTAREDRRISTRHTAPGFGTAGARFGTAGSAWGVPPRGKPLRRGLPRLPARQKRDRPLVPGGRVERVVGDAGTLTEFEGEPTHGVGQATPFPRQTRWMNRAVGLSFGPLTKEEQTES